MWFESWQALARVLLVGAASYVLLVALLRTSGKRTLSKLNAFDLVVTVAMGSTLSSALLSSNVTFAQGATAFLTLVALQYLLARFSVRSAAFARLVRSEPRLLVERGRLLEDALREERITRGEVLAAMRSSGVGRIEDVAAVVLETDGSLSVITAGDEPLSVLEGVKR